MPDARWMKIHATDTTTGGQHANATLANGIRATCSRGTLICLADATAKSYTTRVTAPTRCAGPNPARSPSSDRFGSCRHATWATTTTDQATGAPVICGICASRDSSIRDTDHSGQSRTVTSAAGGTSRGLRPAALPSLVHCGR